MPYDSLRTLLCVVGVILVSVARAGAFEDPSGNATENTDKKSAETEPKQSDGDSKPTPKEATHKVSKAPFKVEVSLKGMFEATEFTEVTLQPEVWKSFEVLEAVEHGAAVKKGDRLIWLDMKRIDEDIRNRKHELELSYLALRQAEEDLRYVEATIPLDRKSVERAKETASEDLERFLKVDRPQSEETAKYYLKSYKDNLEYAEEELDQLQKMYHADDLTEETEEIILKRARRSVEGAQFSLDSSEIRTERTLNIDLPRREEELSEAAKRTNLAHQKTITTLPITLERKRLDLEKKQREHKQSEENLEKLQQDRRIMEIASPADGIVYYGKNDRGKWSSAASLLQQLRRGGNLSANQVFVTIVEPRPLVIRADVPEKDLANVRKGIAGKVVPTAFPDLKLQCTVQYVSPIPISPGTFDGKLKLTMNSEADAIVPGMACTITLVSYEKEDAVAVPKAAVFTDESDEERQYVYVSNADGTHEKRDVKVGQQTDKKTEILAGLKEGDVILLKKPAQDKD